MTETYNPILGRQYLSFRQVMRPIQPSSGTIAHVYVRNGVATQRYPGGSYLERRNDIRYDVDLRDHTISFECSLPSDHDAVEFQADVQLQCWVSEPQIIVQHGIIDACAALQGPLTRQMRLASRSFDTTMSSRSEAEEAVITEIVQHPNWVGFTVADPRVRLGLKDDELEHQRELRRISRKIEIKREEGRLDELVQNHDKRSVEFYNELVQNGSERLALLHLAKHPDEARAIAQELDKLQREDLNHWLEALLKLKSSDAIEEHHFEEMLKLILPIRNRQQREQFLGELLERSVGED